MLLQCEELRHIYYTVVFMYSEAQIPRGVKLLNNCTGSVNFFMGLSLTPPPPKPPTKGNWVPKKEIKPELWGWRREERC